MTNPSFEVSSSGWSTESGATLTRIMTGGLSGPACLQVTNTAINDGAYFRALGDAAVGVTYAQSIWLKAAGAGDVGKSVQGFVRGIGGTFEIPATNSLVLSGAWQRLTFAGAWAHGGHTGWDLVVRCVGTASSFLLDAAQYEEGAYATPYCDGSLGDGYSWTGTAHASSSVREASRLQATMRVETREGAIAAWVRPHWASGDGREHVVCHGSTAGGDVLIEATAAGAWRFVLGAASVEVAQSHAAEADLPIVASWTPQTIMLRVGGVSAHAARGGYSALGATTLDLGRRTDSAAGYLEGVLGPVLMLDRAPPGTPTIPSA